MTAGRTIDVLVEDSDECAGCARRWKAESEPREVRAVRYTPETEPEVVCEVIGWSSEGPCPALSVLVEDSGGGTAVLVWGGDLGLRLRPQGQAVLWAEPYLLISPEDLDPA